MSTTGSAVRDETNRSRRRRRRAAPAAARSDADAAHATSRPSRRGNASATQQRERPGPSTNSRAQSSKNPTRDSQSDMRSSPSSRRRDVIPDSVRKAAEDAEAAESARKAAIEEENARLAREAEEARRAAVAAAQLLQRRGEERLRNLPYLPSRSPDEIAGIRPSDVQLRQLDSSLKKCTGFLRKIRCSGVTEESTQGLCAEAQLLNLSRYISEVVSAMADSKLRSADVEHFITLAGQLHRRYDEFTPQLISALTNVVVTSSAPASKELLLRKAAMRLLVEMFLLAMFADVNHVTSVLRHLMRPVRDSKDEQLNNLSIISSFVRAGTRTLVVKGVPAHSPSEGSDKAHLSCEVVSPVSWEGDVVQPGTKTTIAAALLTYFEGEVVRLVNDSTLDLRKSGEAVTRAKQVRDSPDDATSSAFDCAKQYCDRIVTAANVLADALDKPLFSTPNDLLRPGAQGDLGSPSDARQIFVSNPFSYLSKNRQATQDVMQNADHPFETDEQRMFYTELISVESIATTKNGTVGEDGSRACTGTDGDVDKKGESSVLGDKGTASSQRGSEGRKKGAEKPVSLDKLLGKLGAIETKEAADTFVQHFVASREGSRNGMKRLSKAMYTVSAQKLNVLPAYSRIAATLQPLYNDVGSFVASSLEEDFRYFTGKADVDEKVLAACIKCAQYVGEYVKFGLISISTMFELLSICMKDLSAHRVDVACHLLETCGRYVYRTSSSHLRMGTILDTLWRVKSVRNLEARHNTLIENAFYAVKLSPGNKAQKAKTRPPLREYIRSLIYHRLDDTNITWTRNQLLKLPWDDELEHYVIKKFVKISRARYSTIPHVAGLVASLQKQKPALTVGVVDALLEFIRSGMERNDGRESQRRLAEVFFLGELHNCDVVDDRLIYNVLYQTITLGHESSDFPSQPSRRVVTVPGIVADFDASQDDASQHRTVNGSFTAAPDPPGDFFRIRLVCVLIEACGRTLVAANRRMLEVYWIFLERYLFCKTYQSGLGDRVPLHIDHIMEDVLDGVILGSRRALKDNRAHIRTEAGSTRGGNARGHHAIVDDDQTSHSSTHHPFNRSQNLEDALRAVVQVERSAVDTALICVPMKQVILSPSRTDNGATADAAARGGGSTVTGNLQDELERTNAPGEVQKQSAANGHFSHGEHGQVRDRVGSDSLSDSAVSQEDDDATVGDEDLSEVDVGTDDAIDEYGDVNDSVNDDDDECDDEPEDHDGEGGTDDDDGDDDDGDDDDDDEEDEVVLGVSRSRPKTDEEDAFAKELAAFTAEAVQTARASSSRITRLDRMAIPMSLMTKKLEEERAAAAAQAVNEVDDESLSDELVEEGPQRAGLTDHSAVEFKVLLRKGGKSQLQDLQVPASSSLAVAAKESESADAARHEETKRLVLGSSIVQNEDNYDFEDDDPMHVEQSVRAKAENIRQQRSADERELLATLYRGKPRK